MQIPIVDGSLHYYADFLGYDESIEMLEQLKGSIPWQQNEIFLFGQYRKEPRLTSWHGDIGADYAYSGKQMTTLPWTPELLSLKNKVAALTQTEYNSVLLNYYRDGQDSMGYHQDNEKELGKNPTIASISLGTKRKFLLKHISNKSLERIEIPLSSGSLLVMGGTIQHHWKHAIPKSKKVKAERINLTFRNIIAL